MKGYVLNITPFWTHTMKRAIGPGAKIPLDELYNQYGAKHNINKGKDFIDWLSNVKLRDKNKWKIVIDEDDTLEKKSVIDKKSEDSDKSAPTQVTPFVANELKVEDVVKLSVREGRIKIPKIMDLNLLKYALQEANQLSGKDSLCRLIRKRVRELSLSR